MKTKTLFPLILGLMCWLTLTEANPGLRANSAFQKLSKKSADTVRLSEHLNQKREESEESSAKYQEKVHLKARKHFGFGDLGAEQADNSGERVSRDYAGMIEDVEKKSHFTNKNSAQKSLTSTAKRNGAFENASKHTRKGISLHELDVYPFPDTYPYDEDTSSSFDDSTQLHERVNGKLTNRKQIRAHFSSRDYAGLFPTKREETREKTDLANRDYVDFDDFDLTEALDPSDYARVSRDYAGIFGGPSGAVHRLAKKSDNAGVFAGIFGKAHKLAKKTDHTDISAGMSGEANKFAKKSDNAGVFAGMFGKAHILAKKSDNTGVFAGMFGRFRAARRLPETNSPQAKQQVERDYHDFEGDFPVEESGIDYRKTRDYGGLFGG